MNDQPAADPRTGLALKRTGFATFRTAQALDRTTLAWVRTNLTMATFGLGMVGFFRGLDETAKTPHAARLHQAAIYIGELLVFFGIVATVMAAWSHFKTLRRIENGEVPQSARWPLSIVIAFLLAILGLAGLWELVIVE